MTYLYEKQHSITKLKYFGKCTTRDPLKYIGSGKYWLRHIKKYGIEFVVTLNVWQFEDIQEATEFALRFCKENNIVESNEWANLIEENALDGGPTGRKLSEETRKKITIALLNRSPEIKERIRLSNIGKTHTEETKKLLSIAATGRLHTQEAKDKMSMKMKESWDKNPRCVSDEQKLKISIAGTGRLHTQEAKDRIGNAHRNKIVSEEARAKQSEKAKTRLLTCTYCGLIAQAVTIRRWHNDKCKLKLIDTHECPNSLVEL